MSSGGRHLHKSETRISAIADFVREGKQKKKALPLSLRGLQPLSRSRARPNENADRPGLSASNSDGPSTERPDSARGAAAETTTTAATKTTAAAKAAAAAARAATAPRTTRAGAPGDDLRLAGE